MEAQRQARLMNAQSLIINASDATEARTRTAYLLGYLDALLDEGHLSVYNAQTLRRVATGYRDSRLAAIEAAAMQNPHKEEGSGSL